jgi:pyruvate, water dikinase
MNYIKSLVNISKKDVIIAGGKGASLGEMLSAGFPVPDGFVIMSNAFNYYINENKIKDLILNIIKNTDHNNNKDLEQASKDIKNLILDGNISKKLSNDINFFYIKLDCKYVAVRSSATCEDSVKASWAGQLESYLNTTEDHLISNIKKCWASLFTPRAIFYMKDKGISTESVSVAVVVQKMINSEVSGIAFSIHPITKKKNEILIEACFGLGEGIVGGLINPDSYIYEKKEKLLKEVNISSQDKGLYRSKKGNIWKKISNNFVQKISGKKIVELAVIIINIERYYKFPCDIEWAIENGEIYITQSRPITTL